MKIKSISAREILDSRGIPTLEALITLEDGTTAKGQVPSGASTGTTEVLEMRDRDKKRYFGKGTLKAVEKVNAVIAPSIIGKEFASQVEFDRHLIELDGTELKEKLGGNSILSASMAFCRASAASMQKPLYEYFAEIYWGPGFDHSLLQLPQPMILIMEGGLHGNWATDFQEYMVVPRKEKFPEFKEALRAGAEIFKATHDLLVERGYSGAVGFEGAFAPTTIKSNAEAFDLILEGITKAGYKPDDEIVLAIDIASSEFYNHKTGLYELKREQKSLNREEWIDFQKEMYSQYPIWSTEDPLDEEDWDGWALFTQQFSQSHQIVGDDLLTTNVKRIKKAIDDNAVNSVLIKLNQIGSVTETINAIKLAVSAGYTAVISHRGGETNDDMIADLVVGTAADQSKFGGPDRGERLAKYNRLTEIEEMISQK
ncbi:phosphopyruvate hydratase [Candidatus Nomurabacteria bacterium]|nr:phosphopyruvate hydratase [Candidatus Nomurabacteria bacterium]